MKNPKKNRNYPIPDNEIDKYAVDTRIWDRLDGMGGDGGPHTHDIYANKEHDHPHEHDGYADENHQHIHDHPHDHDDAYAPSGHTHDLTHSHDEFADKEHAHDFTHNHEEYVGVDTFNANHMGIAHKSLEESQAQLNEHLANHPSGGDGGSYDDTALKARVKTNEDDIDALETENNSQNQNIQANTDALADKSDKTHTHPPQDLTHNHDGEYAPTHNHPYASDTHTHDTTHAHEEYQPKGDYSLEGHTHEGGGGDGGPHTHPEYFQTGAETDEDGNAIPLPYENANLLGEAVDGKAEEEHDHDYVSKTGDTMTGALVVNTQASKPLSINGKPGVVLSFYNTGTIAQNPVLDNTNDNHIVNRKNLNDGLAGAVSGLSGTGMGMWIGSQADYDAISPKRTTTLYVVL